MEDKVEILSQITEWTVLQQRDGCAELSLFGTARITNGENYPVLRVVDISCEKTVLYEKLRLNGCEWRRDIRLKTGMYRIETGVALKQADLNPYYLARGDMLRNIFVGEVFVIAGQSNAAGYGRGEVSDMPQYGVSILKDAWELASHPISQMRAGAVNTGELNCGHSAWLSLGKTILEKTHTPVGLVPAALNGSGIDSWEPGQPLFENMVRKAAETGAANLIWYQGCTDTDNPQGYEEKLDNFVQGIRQRLEDIDICIIQISGTTNAARPPLGWRAVREAQRSVAVKYNAMLIPAYDLTDYSDDIHLSPGDNIRLAQRVYQRFADKKTAGDIVVRRHGKCTELEFIGIESLNEEDAGNVIALDECEDPLPCAASISGNIVRINCEERSSIRYISLPFGRLYEGKTLRDIGGNVVPYFCLDMNRYPDA